MRFVKDLEKKYDILLLDRNLVAYKIGNVISLSHRNEFIELVRSGKLNENTIVFNNLVSTLGEFETKWETKLKESWHSEILKL